MKTIARTYAVWAALVLVPSAAVGASPAGWYHAGWLASGAAGQLGNGDSRAQADKLLQSARQAMESGNLKQAESLVTEAEKLNINYGLFAVGDTPKKVRKDLEKLKSNSVTLPSEKATQVGARPETASNPQTLSASGVGNTIGSLSGTDAKSKAVVYLKKGRAELATGDLIAASHWHRQAALEGAEFGPDEDSPYKLAQDITLAGGRVDENPTTTAHNPLAGPIAPPLKDEGHPLGRGSRQPRSLGS